MSGSLNLMAAYCTGALPVRSTDMGIPSPAKHRALLDLKESEPPSGPSTGTGGMPRIMSSPAFANTDKDKEEPTTYTNSMPPAAKPPRPRYRAFGGEPGCFMADDLSDVAMQLSDSFTFKNFKAFSFTSSTMQRPDLGAAGTKDEAATPRPSFFSNMFSAK